MEAQFDLFILFLCFLFLVFLFQLFNDLKKNEDKEYRIRTIIFYAILLGFTASVYFIKDENTILLLGLASAIISFFVRRKYILETVNQIKKDRTRLLKIIINFILILFVMLYCLKIL